MEIQKFATEWHDASHLVVGSPESGEDLSELDRAKVVLWVTKDQALAAGPEGLEVKSAPILVGLQSDLTPEDVVNLTLRFKSVYVAVDRTKSWEALQAITDKARFSGFDVLGRIILVQVESLVESPERRSGITSSEVGLVIRAILATGEVEKNIDTLITQNGQQESVEPPRKKDPSAGQTLPDSYIARRYILSKIPNRPKAFLKRLPQPVKRQLLKYWAKI
ncbi:hypothetical protein [uncultured Corynebacterium sp.]|uniref:hypothetical protein n=1 Tax=uncultured Corynebacterium sp. TaxID=159447 RepID=UPI0025FD56DB|nr:hypothetical protein [uncultured Corynebacterium sp.]